MSKALTALQNKLINELSKEFTRLNPPIGLGVKTPFSLKMIENSLEEEKKFISTISAHNVSMAKALKPSFEKQIKEITKEYSKLFNISVGNQYHNKKVCNDYDKAMLEDASEAKTTNQAIIFFGSKTKTNTGWGYQYANGMQYVPIYCRFKTEKETLVLESGKEVSKQKIVGLTFCNNSWLYEDRESANFSDTIEEFFQNNPEVQRQIIRLCE